MSPVPFAPPSRRRPVGRLVVVAVAAVAVLAAALAETARAGGSARTWDDDTLDLVAKLAVQDGGRVKPVQTYAAFTLLRMNHRKGARTEDGDALAPEAWFLDVVFRPEVARKYPCFLVNDAEVLDAVGLAHEAKKKRDRYTFDELVPAREKLAALASSYGRKEEKDRTPVENGVVELAHALSAFSRLIEFADLGRRDVDLPDVAAVRTLFGGRAKVPALEVAAQLEGLRALVGEDDPHGGGEAATKPEAKAARAVLSSLASLADGASALAIVPPTGTLKDEPEWLSPGDVFFHGATGRPVAPEQAEMLQQFLTMARSADDPAAFRAALASFSRASASLAKARGEYQKIPTEVFLFRLDPFYRSVYFYVFAFLLVAITWAKPSRWLTRGAVVLTCCALALHVAGIVIRCVLRERPPISTLYETTIFVAALGAAACLVAEWIVRNGIGLALAPVLGALTLFVGNKFETLKGEDTMPQLVAVLDTNFWLATHVTCITIGYGGGLVASALAHVHVLGRTFGVRRDDPRFYASITRMTYGFLAFGLLFSVVGTILGGIWANESWGRFWGWDPKENGALMICLSQLAILHARLGGHLKSFGVALATIVSGGIIAFSWWGVNLLQIGLHSYGFSGGIWTGLLTFYAVEALVLLAGLVTLGAGRAYGEAPTALPATGR